MAIWPREPRATYARAVSYGSRPDPDSRNAEECLEGIPQIWPTCCRVETVHVKPPL